MKLEQQIQRDYDHEVIDHLYMTEVGEFSGGRLFDQVFDAFVVGDNIARFAENDRYQHMAMQEQVIAEACGLAPNGWVPWTKEEIAAARRSRARVKALMARGGFR